MVYNDTLGLTICVPRLLYLFFLSLIAVFSSFVIIFQILGLILGQFPVLDPYDPTRSINGVDVDAPAGRAFRLIHDEIIVRFRFIIMIGATFGIWWYVLDGLPLYGMSCGRLTLVR
jgi:hypothetical protein